MDKDTIASEVWGDAVSDAAMTMVMAELRKALGDSAAQPAFIRTVHKRGYAFCAAVSQRPDEPASSSHVIIAEGRRVPLPEGETIAGRDPACGISFNEPSVSWQHARFLVHEGTVSVEDLGSTNGTFVNGSRAKGRVTLRAGDAIEMGKASMTLDPSATRGSGTVKIPGR